MCEFLCFQKMWFQVCSILLSLLKFSLCYLSHHPSHLPSLFPSLFVSPLTLFLFSVSFSLSYSVWFAQDFSQGKGVSSSGSLSFHLCLLRTRWASPAGWKQVGRRVWYPLWPQSSTWGARLSLCWSERQGRREVRPLTYILHSVFLLPHNPCLCHLFAYRQLMETSCSPALARLVVNSCRTRYAPRPEEILSRRKLGYQTGRRCLTCWRKSPWSAVNDKGRNVAGGHSSRPVWGAAGEIPQGIQCAHCWKPRLPLDSCNWLLPTCCSLLELWFIWEKGLRSLHTPGTKRMHGRMALCCNTACAVSLCKGCGVSLSKERASNSAWGAGSGIQRRGYMILKVSMNKRDVFKIRQIKREANSMPLMLRKKCV